MSKQTPAQKLDRMIEYGIITTPENVEKAKMLLSRIAPETMTQEMVAKRWPRICAALIVESLGYFTPRSAANAVLSHKLKQGYGCEYYCFSAGFEKDGWPKERKEYDGKLRNVGLRKIQAAAGCKRYPSNYDECAQCSLYRYYHDPVNERHAGGTCTVFVEKPLDHMGCRHSRLKNTLTGEWRQEYRYALELMRAMAAGAAHPPSLLASWF